VACLDRILAACHRFDKHKNGWVPISCYELALKAAGADLEGATNADRFQTLCEAFGDCVQLDTSENDNRKGLVYYSAVDQRVRTALASTIFASSCEELEKAEARSGKDSLFSAPGGASQWEAQEDVLWRAAIAMIAEAFEEALKGENTGGISRYGDQSRLQTRGEQRGNKEMAKREDPKVALKREKNKGSLSTDPWPREVHAVVVGKEDGSEKRPRVCGGTELARARVCLCAVVDQDDMTNTRPHDAARAKDVSPASRGSEALKRFAAAAILDNARLRAALGAAQTALMKMKGRGRVSEGVKGTAWEDGGFMCGGASADRETLLNAQVLLCRKREEAVEEREKNVARAQSEVEISKLHLEEASLLLQKREKEFTAAANGREPAASNEVKAQPDRGEGDSELQALQAKYTKILQDAECARAEREATLRELTAERQRNAVMRALLNEAAQAADGISVVRALRLVEAERQVG
jgi:hypothetical protein